MNEYFEWYLIQSIIEKKRKLLKHKQINFEEILFEYFDKYV